MPKLGLINYLDKPGVTVLRTCQPLNPTPVLGTCACSKECRITNLVRQKHAQNSQRFSPLSHDEN